MTATPFIVVYITAPAKKSRAVADAILTARAGACVNVVPGIRSSYRWKGKIARDREVLLVVKTRKALFGKLANAVRRAHPYEVPEIIALPIVAGHAPYLKWIKDETRS